ncbi:hypothetical protein SPARK1531C2_00811 [Klebsiella grimontii]|nr:hypothetical protein SPARK1531C2_00811 [Klebsiella grimontii]
MERYEVVYHRSLFNIIYIMRTKIEAARLCGFDQNSVNHPGILLMAHSAQFFTLDEVNPIQDVVDRHLTTQMAAQRLGISALQCRRLLALP